MKSSMLDRYPRRDAAYRVIEGEVTVFDRYRRRMVTLDDLGRRIWLRINGMTTVREIAADIARETGRPLEEVETYTIAMTGIMLGEGLLFLSDKAEPLPYHVSIPSDEQDPEKARESMLAAGWIEE